ncbi:hypothetical protein MLD38_039808 [Melastoma candidum]|uniref:Uncharacterized protein n=1 Tax=Melastoma candidum TaxID=119954 RepID=A0ACB9L374_9MYRT|nr:hypothetical protein MLD38_039808 [Melastoma candidum]
MTPTSSASAADDEHLSSATRKTGFPPGQYNHLSHLSSMKGCTYLEDGSSINSCLSLPLLVTNGAAAVPEVFIFGGQIPRQQLPGALQTQRQTRTGSDLRPPGLPTHLWQQARRIYPWLRQLPPPDRHDNEPSSPKSPDPALLPVPRPNTLRIDQLRRLTTRRQLTHNLAPSLVDVPVCADNLPPVDPASPSSTLAPSGSDQLPNKTNGQTSLPDVPEAGSGETIFPDASPETRISAPHNGNLRPASHLTHLRFGVDDNPLSPLPSSPPRCRRLSPHRAQIQPSWSYNKASPPQAFSGPVIPSPMALLQTFRYPRWHAQPPSSSGAPRDGSSSPALLRQRSSKLSPPVFRSGSAAAPSSSYPHPSPNPVTPTSTNRPAASSQDEPISGIFLERTDVLQCLLRSMSHGRNWVASF